MVRIEEDDFEMVVADIPGLIEGAAEGKGLGHQFLRHVERARVLCVLLDLAPWDGVSPKDQEEALLRELEAYQPDLLDRPRLMVASKADMAPENDYDGLTISSITGAGIPQLTGRLADLVREARSASEADSDMAITIHRPIAESIEIERLSDTSYAVHSRQALRAVRLSDLTEPEALQHAQQRLESLGVNKALRNAGARDGDIIHIGDLSFEYEEDL